MFSVGGIVLLTRLIYMNVQLPHLRKKAVQPKTTSPCFSITFITLCFRVSAGYSLSIDTLKEGWRQKPGQNVVFGMGGKIEYRLETFGVIVGRGGIYVQ